MSAPIRDIGGDGLACSAFAAGSLAGAIALVQRGGACTLSDKVNNAQAAGAVGVVLYQSTTGDTVSVKWNATDTGIPAMLIGNTDGTALKSYLASKGTRVSRSTRRSTRRTCRRTRSGRPRRGDQHRHFSGQCDGKLAVKPELVAPGMGIYTATQKLDPTAGLPCQRLYRRDGHQLCRPDRGRRGGHPEAEKPVADGRAVEVAGGQHRQPAGPGGNRARRG